MAAAGVAAGVGTGAGLLREAVGLGRTLYDALQGVARRARLHYAPPLDVRDACGEVSGFTRRVSGYIWPHRGASCGRWPRCA